ncbi:MAG: prepilin-type N-terminal cleavage/methylation domain-containing protein [Bacilli bacterium]|nr:prepilin-type N-terminal cleavage/methylation domain-containing protein [Bacilli bacterium]
MNKKGFTLIELLAVIVILALLALLTTTSITKLVKDSKKDLSDIQIASIKSAAEAWGAENLGLLPDAGECKYMTLLTLKVNGLIDSNIIDPNTNENISNDLKIKISTIKNSGKDIVSYEINPQTIEGCKYIPNGDVNNDGKVDSQDAIDLSYYLFQGTAQNGSSLETPENGDTDSDGKITVNDINTLSTNLGLVTTTIPGGAGILGDVNGDGLITLSLESEPKDPTLYDLNLMLKYLIGEFTEDDISTINADVNIDGEISTLDSNFLLKACSGTKYKDI